MKKIKSLEIKIMLHALRFYMYEMNKTNNMDDYRAWISTKKKFRDSLNYYRGEWDLKKGVNIMKEFTSLEIDIMIRALEYYKHEMVKTDNMDEYRAWLRIQKKLTDTVELYRINNDYMKGGN